MATIFGDVQYTQNGTVTNPRVGMKHGELLPRLWHKNEVPMDSMDPLPLVVRSNKGT